MSLRQRLSVLLALFAGLLASRNAGAQTLSIYNDTRGVKWPTYHGDINLDHLNINQVNQRDCIYNPDIIFNLLIGTMSTAAWGTANIEAWIGSACDNPTNRLANSLACIKVGSTSVAEHVIKIPAQALVQALSGGDATVDTGGTGGTGGSSGTGGTLLATGGTSATGGTDGGLSVGGTIGAFAEVSGAGGSGGMGGTSGVAGNVNLGGMAGTDGVGGTSASDGASGTGGVSGTAGAGIAGMNSGTAGTESMAGTGGTTSVGGTTDTSVGGTDSTGDVTGGTGGTGSSVSIPTICEGDPTLSTPNARTIFFMVLTGDSQPPNGVTTGTVLKWTYQYDLVGPEAPTNLTAGIGEDSLVLKWSEADNVDTDLLRYQILCDPPPGQPSGQIIGSAGDSGNEISEVPDDVCSSVAFSQGDDVTQDLLNAYNCGTAQLTSTNAQANHLNNYERYAVAVVAQDNFKNYGKVSNVACGTPEPVTDFYEAYRGAGGRGGGGFCSIGIQRSNALIALGAFAGLGLAFRRRARRRRDHDRDHDATQ